jgi:hypothetical protein
VLGNATRGSLDANPTPDSTLLESALVVHRQQIEPAYRRLIGLGHRLHSPKLLNVLDQPEIEMSSRSGAEPWPCGTRQKGTLRARNSGGKTRTPMTSVGITRRKRRTPTGLAIHMRRNQSLFGAVFNSASGELCDSDLIVEFTALQSCSLTLCHLERRPT